MSEPVYCIGRPGEHPARACLADGEAGLLAAVPALAPGRYIVTRDGEPDGWAEVRDDGTWRIECDNVSAGPGYLIV